MSDAWSRDEVELIVADYIAMLASELARRPYSKSAHRLALKPMLRGRSDGSIEFKHQNISAVLINFDLPYINGYKPRQNYQASLEQAVLEHVSADPSQVGALAGSPVLNPDSAPATAFDDLVSLEEAPPQPTAQPTALGRVHQPAVRLIDFAQLDAANRRLGRMGEEWALEYESRRLHDVAARPDLARRIVWVSDAEGDGAGYDLRSFNGDGSKRLIEVKTTGLGKFFPFRVTSNEVRVSEREAHAYQLYRVFDFAESARLYRLPGAISASCALTPTQYLARPGHGARLT